ncbi:aminobenzoyl-glutamate utilization protein A [Cytobacillus purgationiresistens]|uniref:Aminobenzoyl-glutamate utilization protein A n=2 Tax=Cytobacillus purgationiresistens TaxID=863449 RepID=A0ABU0AAD9_9BACI|nr:aminobenzoyl-glutamate utilization protein A [Cytobacillus purgationiresistens]
MEDFIKTITPYLIKTRRRIHQYPEVAWTEYITTATIAEELKSLSFSLSMGKEVLESSKRMGLPTYEEIANNERRAKERGISSHYLDKMKDAHTGLVAKFNTRKPGKHIVLRFDIDALPIDESVESGHIPADHGFSSARPGYMHACGHDGHAAIGIGVAHFIHAFQAELTGRYTLLFQPGEEGGRGAKPMVDKGLLDKADYFISGHIGIHSLKIGDIAATTNKFLASTKINAVYHGKSAHAGLEPNEGKNALLAAAAATLHLNGITRHADGQTRINIGKLEAGSGRNIVADYAKMEIETRGETTELNEDYMVPEAIRILKASAALYDVDPEIEVMGFAPSEECSPEWTNIVEKAARESFSIKKVIPVLPMGASEDATFMLQRVKKVGGSATYMIFGTPLAAGHHHPQFDFDEEVLSVAVEAIGRVILQLQK